MRTTKLVRVHHLRWALPVAGKPINLLYLLSQSAQRSLIVCLHGETPYRQPKDAPAAPEGATGLDSLLKLPG